jgi:PAS domain S-box-containing protein
MYYAALFYYPPVAIIEKVALTMAGTKGPQKGRSGRGNALRQGKTTPGRCAGDAPSFRASIVNDSEDAIITQTSSGTITSWNRGAEIIYGYSNKEAVGQPISILLPPGHIDEVPAILERIAQGERTPHYEAVRRRKDGGAIQVSLSISPLKDGRGRVVGASTIARNITMNACVREKSEDTVNAERKRFNDVLDMLPSYLVLLTPDHHISFANHYFREKFGEPGGHRCYEALFGRTEPCEKCETYKVLRTNSPLRWEWTGPNGRVYDVIDFPYIDTDGTTLIMESGIDITERKVVEEALRKARDYNRSLIEASLDPLVTIGPDGKVTDVNAATEAVTGYGRGELIGTDFSDYFTEPANARAGYEQVFREGLVRDYALEIRRRDGHITPVLYNASVYRDDAGQVIGVFAAARDITAQWKVEDELAQQRRRELERLAELEKFQRLTVGRELKMVELKKEIEELRRENEDLKSKKT